MSEYLSLHGMEHYRNWNAYAEAGRSFIRGEISELIEERRKREDLDDVFVDCVEWDLLHSFIYDHYKIGAGVVDGELPDFYGRILEVYEKGHFPCGWEGGAMEPSSLCKMMNKCI